MEKVTTNSSSQSKIGDNSQAEKKDLTLHYNEVPSMQQQTQFTCSLYISRAGLQDQGYGIPGDTLQYICHILKKCDNAFYLVYII